MANLFSRKTLSAPGLLRELRSCFDRIEDNITHRGLTLTDCLMSGLAVFGLKYAPGHPRQHDDSVEPFIWGQASAIDTALRESGHGGPTGDWQAVVQCAAARQGAGGLHLFHYLLSVDGTGYFSSSTVHCANCCEKHHRDGRTILPPVLGAVLVHPEQREVFPLAPEPIVKEDGAKKNDCRNAAKRLLQDVRREHPHLKLLVVEDALASNGPHIELLKTLDMRFVLGVKHHKHLFEWVDTTAALPQVRCRPSSGHEQDVLALLPLLQRGPAERREFRVGGQFPGILGAASPARNNTSHDGPAH